MNYSEILDMALVDRVMFSIYVVVILTYFNWYICFAHHVKLCVSCDIPQVRGHLRQHLIFIAMIICLQSVLFYGRATFPYVEVDGVQTLALYYGLEPIGWFLTSAMNIFIPRHLSSEIQSEIYVRSRYKACSKSYE